MIMRRISASRVDRITQMLVDGNSVNYIAKMTKVTRLSVRKIHDGNREYISQTRADVTGEARECVRALAGVAVDVLAQAMEDENIRIRLDAAKIVIGYIGESAQQGTILEKLRVIMLKGDDPVE